MKVFIVSLMIFLYAPCAFAKDPDCAGTERWPTKMAFVTLKNAGITDNVKVNFDKTKTIRLASEKIGKDLYRQVHYITFTETTGKAIEVITVKDIGVASLGLT